MAWRLTDPARVARRPHRALETIHGMIYFAPAAQDAYARIGLTHHRTGFFASLWAAMVRCAPRS